MTWAVGDLIALRLQTGFAHGLIVMHPAAYPPAIGFVRGLRRTPHKDARAALGDGDTITVLMPLPRPPSQALRILSRGHKVPIVRFQIPVRDRAGRVLYRWIWDGTHITVADDPGAIQLPERRILPPADLERLLIDPQDRERST